MTTIQKLLSFVLCSHALIAQHTLNVYIMVKEPASMHQTLSRTSGWLVNRLKEKANVDIRRKSESKRHATLDYYTISVSSKDDACVKKIARDVYQAARQRFNKVMPGRIRLTFDCIKRKGSYLVAGFKPGSDNQAHIYKAIVNDILTSVSALYPSVQRQFAPDDLHISLTQKISPEDLIKLDAFKLPDGARFNVKNLRLVDQGNVYSQLFELAFTIDKSIDENGLLFVSITDPEKKMAPFNYSGQ